MKHNYFLICCALFVFGCFGNTYAQVKIIQTIAGTGTAGYSGDGAAATGAKLNQNYFIALDAAGDLYIADYGNNRIREINTSGIITTVAGNGMAGFADGAASSAEFNSPEGIALDMAGNIYVGDYLNNRIRMISTSGIVSTIAGTGTAGYTGDGSAATAAEINSPRGVAVDVSGNVYFADGGATTVRVRKIAGGMITTVAGDGTAGYTGDGVIATTTELNNPRGVYVDGSGDVYIADMSNNRIRLANAFSFLITTLIGNGTAGYAPPGDGVLATAAKLDAPTDIKMDAGLNFYVADAGNDRIRMVSSSTFDISTIAGSGTPGWAGDGYPATAANVKLNAPVALAIAPNGNIYISDRSNNRIRVIRNNSTPYFTGGSRQSITVCENSIGDSLNAYLSIIDSDMGQTETWTDSVAPLNGTVTLGGTLTSTGGGLTPTGISYTPTAGYSGTDVFVMKVSDGYSFSLDTFYVTVNPLPTVAAITGPTSVCVAGSMTLMDATATGAWSSSNSNATVGAGTGFVTGAAAGTVTISYTVYNSCGPTSSLYTVTVNPLPNAGTIAGLSSVCVGSNITLTDAVGTGTWSTTGTVASVGAGSGLVTGLSAGTAIISYNVSNSCGSSAATQPVTVLAIPSAGTITGASSVCPSASITLTDATGATGGVWSASNSNATVGSATGSVNGVTAGTDLISYTVSNVCGSASATKNITINPLPNAGTITGASGVCIAASVTLTDAAGPGVWSSPSATVSVGSGSGSVTGVSGGTAIISYTVTNVCGTAVATYPINVITIPTAGTISGLTSVCQSANITLSDGVTGGSWSSGSTAIAMVGTGSGIVTGVSGGTAIISYTVSYSCGSAYASYAITVNPLPAPASITGPTSVCLGSSATLADATFGGVWGASNAHATVSGGTLTGVSAGVDTISYSVTNGCGTVAATYSVTVSPIVAPTVSISANPGLTSCPGALVTYSATPVYGGPSPAFEWFVDGTVVAGTQSFVYTPSNGDTIIVKMGSDAACISISTVSDTARVVVNPDLVPAVSISTGIYGTVLCVGTPTPFTATPTNGGTAPTYQWLVNGVSTGTGNPFNYTPNNGDMVSAIITSSYACAVPATAMSNTVTMTVNTSETPSISITASPGSTVCAGTDVTFSAIPIYGGIAPEIRWTKDGTNVATGPTYHYIPANGDHVYAMLASSASCSTLDSVFSNTIGMTVNAVVVPVVSITSSTTYISVGQSTTFTANITGTSLPTYQWYVNGVAVPGANSSTYTLTGAIAGTDNVTCLGGSTDACTTSVPSNSIIITVNDLGVATIASGSGITLLPNPNSGSFTIEGTLSAGNDNATMEITDILGRMVYHQVAPVQSGALKQQITLNNELSNGVYLMHITSGSNSQVIRFTLSR